MSEQTGVYGDLDSLECLNIWSVWRFGQSQIFEYLECLEICTVWNV